MWKTIFALPCILLFFVAVLPASEHQGPQLTFATEGHDCGTIYFDEVNVKTIDIEFSNTGDAPLVISNVRACCGTRVTEWTREPVLPGENGIINVSFRVPNRPHAISRVVTVESNSASGSRNRFRIKGRVVQRPE